jgi:hypothetical protein
VTDDLIAALGLVLVLEGVLYALFPDAMRRWVVRMVQQSATSLRLAGLASAFVGLVIVRLVRG